MNNIDQADGIDIKDSGGIGIAAHLRRIAGDANQITNADRRRAQQVRLNAEYVAIAAGVVQNGFDPGLLLQSVDKA